MAEIQKEFFDEFEKKDRKKRSSFRHSGTKQISFSLSFDTLLLGVLLLVISVVIVYAIGVELGRQERLRLTRKEDVMAEAQLGKVQQVPVPPEERSSSPKQKPVRKYTIQVASFAKKESAGRELEKLKNEKEGIEVFLISGTKQIAVCVGTYETRVDANRALSELRKRYKDSFVRNR